MARIVWLDLGDPGVFVFPSAPLDRWQDHGLGLLRTILDRAGIETDLVSLRSLRAWSELPARLRRYETLLMNVRSYTFPLARTAATLFKQANPQGRVVVGGLHATVALSELVDEQAFDHICVGPGEKVIEAIASDPGSFPRVVRGGGSESMDDWPAMDRRLWPNPGLPDFPWPLEPPCGWGPGPVATMLTSKVCPWRCSFCNEAAYIAHAQRRSVHSLIDELNFLDRRHGPLGSVVLHDSMFFQHPAWLEQWLNDYPTKTRGWPYWAAARADTVRRWPELFESLVTFGGWHTVSIGFESGSDRILKVLNKECTLEDNLFTIELLNRIGDDFVRRGEDPPKFWANIMLAIPGETRRDVYATMALLKLMKYRIPSISYYAPYPGSALGHQIIAEGKSLLGQDDYHRNPGDQKVAGIDYDFYRDVRQGRYEREVEIEARKMAELTADLGPKSSSGASSRFFLFQPKGGGKKKLSYGPSPEDAWEVLGTRLTAVELDRLDPKPVQLTQKELPDHYDELG